MLDLKNYEVKSDPSSTVSTASETLLQDGFTATVPTAKRKSAHPDGSIQEWRGSDSIV
jgi:hypothetical protein